MHRLGFKIKIVFKSIIFLMRIESTLITWIIISIIMIHQLSSGSGGRKQVDRTLLPFGGHSVQRFDDELRAVSFEKDISSLSTGQVD